MPALARSTLKFEPTFDPLDPLAQAVNAVSICQNFGKILSAIAGKPSHKRFKVRESGQHFSIAIARSRLFYLNFLQVREDKIVAPVRHGPRLCPKTHGISSIFGSLGVWG